MSTPILDALIKGDLYVVPLKSAHPSRRLENRLTGRRSESQRHIVTRRRQNDSGPVRPSIDRPVPNPRAGRVADDAVARPGGIEKALQRRRATLQDSTRGSDGGIWYNLRSPWFGEHRARLRQSHEWAAYRKQAEQQNLAPSHGPERPA
jgi:hypothetical protein